MAPPAIYAELVVADGASHYWRLGETTGTTAADSVGGAPGTITGGVTLGQPGPLLDGTPAMLFDGTTGYVGLGNLADLAFTGAFSVECWMQSTATGATNRYIVSKEDGAGNGWHLELFNGQLVFVAHTAVHVVVFLCTTPVIPAFNDGLWHHVVGRWDGTTGPTGAALYVDGALTAATAPFGGVPAVNAAPGTIGALANTFFFFPGAIDEVAVYPHALTHTQIAAHYDARLVRPPPAPNVVIATLDKTRSTRAYSLHYEYTLGARGRATFEIVDQDSTETAYRPQVDDRVELHHQGVIIFRGSILSLNDKPLGDPGVGTVTAVTAVDDWTIASLRRVNKSYAAGLTLKTIVEDLVATYLAIYGLTVGAWPPSNLTGPIMPAVTFDNCTLEDAFNQLVDLSGTWVYRLNPTSDIIWFGPGHRVEGVVFSAANKNILGPITWTKTRVQHANRVIVRYGTGLVGTGQTFTGNGTQIRFPLTFPVAQVGHLTYEGSPPYPPGKSGIELVGPDASTPRPWYIDAATQELVRKIGAGIPGGVAGPPAAGHIIRFYYNVQYPLTVSAQTAEAATFPIDMIVERADIFSAAQALALAQSQLEKITAMPRLVTMSTRLAGTERILPGDSIKINVPERLLPLSAAPLGYLLTETRVVIDVDQAPTVTWTLLEPTGGPLVRSWIAFWRDVVSAGSGSGIASGSVIPPPYTPTSPPPTDIGAGNWTPIPYAAGNFTGSAGMIWQVDAGDLISLTFTKFGNATIVVVNINPTGLSGTMGNTLYVKLPFPASGNAQAVGRYWAGTDYEPLLLYVQAGDDRIGLTPLQNRNFVAAASFLVQGTIIFPTAG